MSRMFTGTVEELDSELHMIWKQLKAWEESEHPIDVLRIISLRKTLRDNNSERARMMPPKKRAWIQRGAIWRVDGYPICVRFDPFSDAPWTVHGIKEAGSETLAIARAGSWDEAKAFAEDRCLMIDLFREGPPT